MAIKFWAGGVGVWSNPANWKGGPPGYRDLAVVQSGAAVDCGNLNLNGITLLVQQTTPQYIFLGLAGTVIGPQSSIVTQGNNTTITLQNTSLLGSTYISTGTVAMPINPNSNAVNAGNMVVVGYSGPAILNLDANRGGYTNTGTMHVETNGSLNISYGGQHPTSPQAISNAGRIEASDGGTFTFDAAHAFTQSFGTVFNSGLIDANNGTVTINADLNQTDGAVTHIENNGTLNLNGVATAGTIEITSGTLNFGEFSRGNPGPFSSENFASHLTLDGLTASLGFGAVPVQESFNAATQELIVNSLSGGKPTVIGDFTLNNGSGGFTASEFSIDAKGTSVLFTHTPISG